MPFVKTMVNMCQFHHLSTEMVDENLQIVPKSTPIDTKQAYPIKITECQGLNEGSKQILSQM